VPSPQDPIKVRAQARVGHVLRDKWRLDSLLGVGGMAAVYAATHRNGKRGAVKLLHLELSTHEEARQRFLREGYVANAVGHPGVVSVVDDDVTEDGAVFLVMELLEGVTMEQLCSSRPGERLSPGEVLAMADQVLETLGAAHRQRIVHRDLKPENLFLTTSGQVKVLDFGLARLLDGVAGAARLTTTNTAMGTPAFLPPEQARGEWSSVDGRTDLWALGATMFTLLTGAFVHQADNLNMLLLAAMTKSARPTADVNASVPRAVAAIVDRALAFDAAKRYPDAAAMRADVVRARESLPAKLRASLGDGVPVVGAAPGDAVGTQSVIGTSSSIRPGRRRTPLLVASGVTALGLALATAVFFLRQPPPGGSLAHDVPGAQAVTGDVPSAAVVPPVAVDVTVAPAGAAPPRPSAKSPVASATPSASAPAGIDTPPRRTRPKAPQAPTAKSPGPPAAPAHEGLL